MANEVRLQAKPRRSVDRKYRIVQSGSHRDTEADSRYKQRHQVACVGFLADCCSPRNTLVLSHGLL